jgi:hypothetical protein
VLYIYDISRLRVKILVHVLTAEENTQNSEKSIIKCDCAKTVVIAYLNSA